MCVGVGGRTKNVSNRIAFRWKIHFKLKINVLQKHILSFAIDNINSSVYFLWQSVLKFTFLFLCVSLSLPLPVCVCVCVLARRKSRIQIAITLCYLCILTLKYSGKRTFYMKNPCTKIHDKSSVALCSVAFICFAHILTCICVCYIPQMK